MFLRPLQAACFVLLAQTLTAHAASTYHVNPTSGNDANSGTASAPLKTLSKANAKAIAGDTIYLAAGQTFLEPLVARSGLNYTSDAANRAVISGSRQVDITGTAWTKVGNIYSATVPASITGKVTQVTYGSAKTRMVRARTPNIGQGEFGIDKNQFARVTQGGDATTLNVASNIVKAGENPAGATAMIRTRGSDLNEYVVKGWKAGSNTSLDVEAVSFVPEWYIANLYTIPAGHGYWLENQLWMLDIGNEWFFDPATRRLHLWMPNGLTPQGQGIYAAVMPNGIVAKDVSNVNISNITVLDTAADGVSMVNTSGVTLNNVSVARSGERGISMTGSNGNTITGCTVDRSGLDGIYLGRIWSLFKPTPPKTIMRSVNINVVNSTISNSGLNGFAQAAVRLGEGGQFSNNVVQNTTNVGVIASMNNVIDKNLVLNSCTLSEDCGGIYVEQPPTDEAKFLAASASTALTRVKVSNNLKITNNIVDGGAGSGDGVPPGAGTDTRGIYLDDYANGVTVSGNFVTGMKHGFMLHTAFNNGVFSNLAIGNRSHNLLLQEDAVPTKDGQTSVRGEMKDNNLVLNAMVASRNPTITGLAIPNILHTAEGGWGNTRQFGLYDGNKYATLNPNSPTVLAYNYGQDVAPADMDLTSWRGIGNDINSAVFYGYKSDGEAYGFYNSAATGNKTIACPTPVAANCSKFINLRTGAAVAFPLTLQPKTAIIVLR